tara:strand:+ start:16837 stop:18156 length:1320 start_codon:yes stop_codon:yes gene_type:complete
MTSNEITKIIDLTDIDLENINNTNNANYIIKDYFYNNNSYKIIKYNKEKLKEFEKHDINKFNHLSKFRSIIIKNNKLQVYSPEKSINFENFKNKYVNTEECWIEDFIDGTMINVFFDINNNEWEISTRSTVGGNIIFFNDIKNYKYFPNNMENHNYNNVTFRSMFFEACNLNNFDLNSLNPRYSYSFLMQHPYNRIVTPIHTPLIYLIKIYEINNNEYPIVKVTEKNIYNFCNEAPYIFLNTNIKFINKYPIDKSYDNIQNDFINNKMPYYCVGIVLHNIDGTRSKIRNNSYENVRKLRGNQPKLQFNYLSLKKDNKIKEYLSYYPEHIILFNKFKLLVYSYTQDLYINYINCFIKKEKPLKEYPFNFKIHMYKIHNIYINKLKSENKIVDKKVVIDYFNDLHPAQQMFIINNKFKNNNIEENMEEENMEEENMEEENM